MSDMKYVDMTPAYSWAVGAVSANSVASNGAEFQPEKMGSFAFTCEFISTAGANESVKVYAIKGNTAGNLADAGNKVPLGSVLLDGTNTVRKTLFLHDPGPYNELYIQTPTNYGLAAGSKIDGKVKAFVL